MEKKGRTHQGRLQQDRWTRFIEMLTGKAKLRMPWGKGKMPMTKRIASNIFQSGKGKKKTTYQLFSPVTMQNGQWWLGQRRGEGEALLSSQNYSFLNLFHLPDQMLSYSVLKQIYLCHSLSRWNSETNIQNEAKPLIIPFPFRNESHVAIFKNSHAIWDGG